MNLVVTLEHRFDRTPDGAVWTPMLYGYSFWTRYLDVFDGVTILARTRESSAAPTDGQRVDGDSIAVAGIPYYLGPWQYLQKFNQVGRTARSSVRPTDAVILRVSSQVAACVEPLLHRTGHPYGVEVVGDPYDVFAPGAIKHPLRPVFRWLFTRRLRRQCARADAAAYVTAHALQRRYPCPNYSVNYSSIQLSDDDFVLAPRSAREHKSVFTIVSVTSFAHLYKAPDVLIDAATACLANGLNLRLVLVGDGMYRPEMEARAAACGLSTHVQFAGQLSVRSAVKTQLDQADLFVLPSRQEGLPRAMIEAMARALPCIGSTVGGIPELLPAEDMVPPGDAFALAAKIRSVLADPARMVRMSTRNLQAAKAYHEDILRARRIAFYREVREITAAWVRWQETAPSAPGSKAREACR